VISLQKLIAFFN